MAIAANPLGTFVSYFGGKSGTLAEKIAALLPPHEVYGEFFGGAAGVLLNKAPSSIEIYNDVSDGIVTLFRVVRDPEKRARLENLLNLTPYARSELLWCREAYKNRTTAGRPALDEIELARTTYVQLCQGFTPILNNGGWSFGGVNHQTNVARTFYRGLDNIAPVGRRLQNVLIESQPALQLIRRWDAPEVCLYLDPPYYPATRTAKAKNSAKYECEMTATEHEELIAACLESRSKIILSGYSSQLYGQLDRAGWHRIEYQCVASSAVFTLGNGLKGRDRALAKRTECLWLSPNCQKGQMKLW
jgi:DNA adenine methylase